MLRLVSSTVGPLPVSSGASPAAQVVEAFNAGDGGLSLSVKSSVDWIAASIGAARTCVKTTDAKSCLPVQLALNTTALAAGVYTGIVTVSDPNAVDAPQTITVTVRVGGIDLYAAPGTSRDTTIATSSMVNAKASTQDGASWLSVVLDGTGSFRFSFPYRIRFQPPSGMGQGTYTGSVSTTGSATASEDMTIPATMRVTTQPIAEASPDNLSYRLAQGAPPATLAVAFANVGQGSLVLQTPSATGSGLSAAVSGATLAVTFDAGSLAPGVYKGSVAVPTNAANGAVTIPVIFEVVAKSAPLIAYQGVQDNATYTPGGAVAPGEVVIIKGEQLSFAPLTIGKAPPLDTQIGGAGILVNGKAAPMYYSSYGQLAFQMPVDTPVGTALVEVQRDGLTSNIASVPVAARAPGLLVFAGTSYGAIVNAADGSYPMSPAVMPACSLPGYLCHPAHAGDTIVLYAIGLGPTSPAVATGAAAPSAEPLARLVTTPMVNFGGSALGIEAVPAFAGLTPTYAGLYQVNVAIPAGVAKGVVEINLGFPDAGSNRVEIEVQ